MGEEEKGCGKRNNFQRTRNDFDRGNSPPEKMYFILVLSLAWMLITVMVMGEKHAGTRVKSVDPNTAVHFLVSLSLNNQAGKLLLLLKRIVVGC